MCCPQGNGAVALVHGAADRLRHQGARRVASAFVMTDIGQRVVRDLRDRLFRHILDQSATFFSRHTSGQLMSRITNDVNQVQQAVSETVGDLMREGLSLVGLAGYLFYLDARLALVAVTGAPLVVYPLVRFGKRIRSTTRRSQEHLEHLSHVTAEAFTGHRIVKAFGAEAREEERFSQASQRLYRTNLKVTSALALLPPLMELLGGVAVVGLVWYGSRQIAEKALTAGRLRGVCRGRLHDVRADQETQPRQCHAAAGDGGVGTHFRNARHALGGAGAARRQPLTRARDRRSSSETSASRTTRRPKTILKDVSFTRARWPGGGARRAERRREDHAREPDSAVLRRQRRQRS